MEKKMVSPTAQTRVIRANKKHTAGRKRKNRIANKGSTRSQAELFGSEKPEQK
jgi:hypothetical protein